MPDKKKINPQGKDVGTLVLEKLAQLPELIWKTNPLVRGADALGRVSGMVGAASTFVPGREGEGNRVVGQMIKEASPNKLNPMQENVLKAVQKVHTKNVEAAMEQGASGEQVLADAGISFGANQPTPETSETGVTETDPLSVALSGQQPSELIGEQATKIPPTPSFLGITQHPAVRAQVLENLIREQQIKGQVPLQAGEREKLEITAFNNLLTTGNKALSADAAKVVGNIESGMEQLNALSVAFEKDPTIFTTTNLSEVGQQVNLMRTDLIDILGRLRSGGAINKDEFVSFMKQIPKQGPVAGRIEKPATVRLKIQKLQKLFQSIKSKAQPNTGLSQGIQAAIQAGFSRQEIMARLKTKGVL